MTEIANDIHSQLDAARVHRIVEPVTPDAVRNALGAAGFLDRFGLRLCDVATAEPLRDRYLAPSGRERLTRAQSEMIGVAENAGSR
jgi:hypothetical protein